MRAGELGVGGTGAQAALSRSQTGPRPGKLQPYSLLACPPGRASPPPLSDPPQWAAPLSPACCRQPRPGRGSRSRVAPVSLNSPFDRRGPPSACACAAGGTQAHCSSRPRATEHARSQEAARPRWLRPSLPVVMVKRWTLSLWDPSGWKLEAGAMEYTGSEYIGKFVDGR